MHEESRTNQSFTEWYECSNKCGVMDTNIESTKLNPLTLKNFKLLGIRYGETNAVTQRV